MTAQEVIDRLEAPPVPLKNDLLRRNPATASFMHRIGFAKDARELLVLLKKVEASALPEDLKDGVLDYLAARTVSVQVFGEAGTEQNPTMTKNNFAVNHNTKRKINMSATTANVKAIENGHWYQLDGSPCESAKQ
jgi:hypothetical protein